MGSYPEMSPETGRAMRQVEAEFAAQLAAVRPALSHAYAAALPGARAAVLGRLWRGLLHEPLPGVAAAGEGVVLLEDGRVLTGPRRLPYDLHPEPALRLEGREHDHPAELMAALGLPRTAGLVEALDDSVASMALSRARAPGGGLAGQERDRVTHGHPATDERSVAHEQSVTDGHPYHPLCRARPGFSVCEQLRYLPEHHPIVPLDLVAAPEASCAVAGRWPADLLDGSRLLLPVHPWQTRHVLPGLGLRPYQAGAVPAHPLMAVRTLAPLAGGPHVKTALSARLTSAVRDISPGSVRDSVPLSDLVARVADRLGGRLRVARYVTAAAAMVRGEHRPELAAMLREPTSAFTGPDETAVPVAALTRDLVTDPPRWLASFARLALGAGLGMLALGVGLEAHGQNLLVVLDGRGRPVRLVYRDLADVRLSPARLRHAGFDVPPLSARLLSDDPGVLRTKLYASLVGTTCGSLVALLGGGDRAAESALWEIVADAALAASSDPAHPRGPYAAADLEALFAPGLPGKAYTVMRLDGAPPGDVWISLPNPLATHRRRPAR
ncbi:IucA/IucC family protein [Nonomuraea pusilla]|uniref:Ferric iron reductase FhuF-like transporter n=1 Tax=Nonomuraea pusilla TaxID=46177 RepID=A0A1H8HXE4_9ACTN|nr:IucA/IucC family siderophore biosynthesis protein [Nonomuraea pusilla]SEN60684.1 Ferric iron reductase FhuF-like transporter [Nonomuraea pusilla]